MIVHPDFFHHFKTRKLIKLTGNNAARLWVLKLWAYSQIKRTSRFENLSDATLADVLEYEIHSSYRAALARLRIYRSGWQRNHCARLGQGKCPTSCELV